MFWTIVFAVIVAYLLLEFSPLIIAGFIGLISVLARRSPSKAGVRDHKKLYRFPRSGMVAGVAAGIAHYFEVDSVFVRLAWLAVGLITHIWPALVLYIIVAFVVPVDPTQESVSQHQAPKDITPEQ